MRVRRGVGTLVVAVLVAGIAGCHEAGASHALRAPAAACAQPVVPASRTVARARPDGMSIGQPGGGGAITVAAVGFSQTRNGSLSIGAEIGNSGTRIAYGTELVFQGFGTGGADVIEQKLVTIPVILPGERVPAGLPATSRDDPAWAFHPKVQRVRAKLILTQWLPGSGVGEFPRVSLRLDPPPVRLGSDGGMTEVQIKGDTNACTSEPATQVGVVYRDKAGAIVGGAVATTADISRMVAFSGCMVGGFAGGVFAFGSAPATADLSRTEAALYCDPAKPVLPTPPPME
jgi:hypothetical protein